MAIDTGKGKMQMVKLNTNLRLFERPDHELPFYGKGTVIKIPKSLAQELLTAKNVEFVPDGTQEKMVDLIHEAVHGPKFQGKPGLTEEDVQVLIEEALDRQKKALTSEFEHKLKEAVKKG